MTDTDTQFPLELNQPRLSIQKPEPRYDKQGEMADAERLDRAMRGFVKDFGATAALYMESCVHCGQCAEVCQYYVQTGDPRYTPIWKLEPFKQAYKRETGPFAPFFRLFNLKRRVTVQELEDWQDLIYDSCTQCGRCTMVCPMGIDIASLVGLARHGMAAAGLVPHELWATVERANREGSPLGATPAVLKDRIAWLEDEHGVEIPLGSGTGRRPDDHLLHRGHEISPVHRRPGQDHEADGRLLDLSQRWLRGHQFQHVRRRPAGSAGSEPQAHRSRHRGGRQDPHSAGMRPCLSGPALAGRQPLRQASALPGGAGRRVPGRRDPPGQAAVATGTEFGDLPRSLPDRAPRRRQRGAAGGA
ncbi:iron-sulfur cluster-binding protein, partial [Acidithiobacillus sp. GGI-221]